MIYFLLVLAFLVGYHLRDIKEKLVWLAAKVLELKEAQTKAKTPETNFAEPMSRAELAGMAEQERIKLLNPNG